MTLESFDSDLELNALYDELKKLGADTESIRKLDPTERQLQDLLNGLLKLNRRYRDLN